MALFAVFVLCGAFMLLPAYGSFVFVAYSTCLCAVLVATCWVKGVTSVVALGRPMKLPDPRCIRLATARFARIRERVNRER